MNARSKLHVHARPPDRPRIWKGQGMTVGSHRPNTDITRARRRFRGIALAMPAVIIAGLLMLPGASTAGEGEPVVYDSRTGIVPPGGSLTTLDGPLNADDPFAVALKNIST